MSNAAHLLDDVRAAAAAIANARAGRRGAPAIVNVLDILPTKLFDEVVEDARAVIAAIAALPPKPRQRGPLGVADAQALRLDRGAERVALLAWMPGDGPVEFSVAAVGNRTAAGDIARLSADAAWAALAAARVPTTPPQQERTP